MIHDGRPRFGHLIYTSFDDGSGSGGGWQIKDTTGDLQSAEREALTAWVTTRFDLVPQLDRYPTPEAIEQRQRRLVYARTAAGAAYWHTVEAGTDGSGRPGNVFAHVVLDRFSENPQPAFRPIESWHSPSWLVPYGPAATRAAALSVGDLPVGGGVITRERVVEFLADASIFRLGILQVLLDAVGAALDGGSPVVLMIADPADAPYWIGAVSYFMSPGTSRVFTWSTHDRADAVEESIRRNIHLTVVPAGDRDALTTLRGFVLLSDNDDATLGVLDGEGHSTADGVRVEVTPWSLLAQAVLIDDTTALIALTAQDDVAREVGDEGLSPMWPLAAAVIQMPETEDVVREASRVIVENRPRSLDHMSRLAVLTDRIEAENAPEVVDDARSAVIRAFRRGRDASSALGHYLRLVLTDSHSVPMRDESVRATFTRPLSGYFSGVVRDAIERAGSSADGSPSDRTVRVLRVADLLMATEADSAVDFDLIEVLSRAVEDVSDALVRSDTRNVVEQLGSLHERTLRMVVRPVVATLASLQVQAFGRRYSNLLLTWLYPGAPKVPHLQQIAAGSVSAETHHDIALYAEYGYGFLISGWGDSKGWHVMLKYADLAIWGLLVDMRDRRNSSDRIAEVRHLASLGTLSAADVRALFEMFDELVPAGIAHRVVMAEERTPVVDWVLDRVRATPGIRTLSDGAGPVDAAARAWADVRLVDGWHTTDKHHVQRLLDHSFEVLVDDYVASKSASVPVMPATDALAALAILVEIAESQGRHSPVLSPSDRAALASWIDDHPEVLQSLVDNGVIDVDTLVGRAFADFVDTTGRSEGGPSGRTDAFIKDLVRRGVYDGPTDDDSLRDAMWPTVRQKRAAHAERLLTTYRQFSAQWLQSMAIGRVAADAPSVRGGEIVTRMDMQ